MFYVQEQSAGVLSEERAASAAHRDPRGAGAHLHRPQRIVRARCTGVLLGNPVHLPRTIRLGRADNLGPPASAPRPRGIHCVFATLSDRLSETFKNLRGKGRLSEADIDATAREIRLALLEADVALPVVKEFVEAVKERARGAEVSQALNPAQQVIKIVDEELVDDPRRRDPPAALRQDPADRDHAGRPPGRRQDHAGRQAGALAQGPGQEPDAGRLRPPAPQRRAAAPGQRRAGRRHRLRARARQRRGRPGGRRAPGDRGGPPYPPRRRHRRHRRPPRHRRRADAAGRGHPRRRRTPTRCSSSSTR